MKILELEEYHQLYEVDSVNYNNDIEKTIEKFNPSVIYILGEGTNPYSGRGPVCPNFEWFSNYTINRSSLFNVINECKLFKTHEEIELMKNAAKVGCDAHIFVMKNIKPGMNEAHMQTLFRVMFLKLNLFIYLFFSFYHVSLITTLSALMKRSAPLAKTLLYCIMSTITMTFKMAIYSLWMPVLGSITTALI